MNKIRFPRMYFEYEVIFKCPYCGQSCSNNTLEEIGWSVSRRKTKTYFHLACVKVTNRQKGAE